MTYRGNINKWIKEGKSLKIKGKLILNGKTIQAFYESSLENPAFWLAQVQAIYLISSKSASGEKPLVVIYQILNKNLEKYQEELPCEIVLS